MDSDRSYTSLRFSSVPSLADFPITLPPGPALSENPAEPQRTPSAPAQMEPKFEDNEHSRLHGSSAPTVASKTSQAPLANISNKSKSMMSDLVLYSDSDDSYEGDEGNDGNGKDDDSMHDSLSITSTREHKARSARPKTSLDLKELFAQKFDTVQDPVQNPVQKPIQDPTPDPTRDPDEDEDSEDSEDSEESEDPKELILDKWNINSLDDMFQLRKDLCPRQWLAETVKIVWEIAQVLDRATAEKILIAEVRERVKSQKHLLKVRPRFSKKDGVALLERLSNGEDLTAVVAEEDQSSRYSRRNESSNIAEAKSGRFTPRVSNKLDQSASVLSEDSDEDYPPRSRKRRRVHLRESPSTTPQSYQQRDKVTGGQEHKKVSTSSANATPDLFKEAELDDPDLELGRLLVDLDRRKEELDAARTAYDEIDVEWQRLEKKRNEALKLLKNVKRKNDHRNKEMRDEVDGLVDKLPGPFGAQLGAYLEKIGAGGMHESR